jgi:lipoic acid synthetase
MGLSYVVITSVTRDDLPDGGARFFAKTIEKIRQKTPKAQVEVLIPDFQGDAKALQTVLQARPHVLNHNVETVERLYPSVRPQARYRGSLDLFKRAEAFNPAIPRKSGLMLGLGELPGEVEKTLEDLLVSGCSILTLGQYLRPSKNHLPVKRFVSPEEFHDWKQRAMKMGFRQVASGPFVRSSYRAKELRASLAQ